jgi:hypothetical protein
MQTSPWSTKINRYTELAKNKRKNKPLQKFSITLFTILKVISLDKTYILALQKTNKE